MAVVSALRKEWRVVRVTPQTLELLQLRIVGRGGWQSLFRRIQAGLDGDVLTIAEADVSALVRLAVKDKRRRGGFQERAIALWADLFWVKLYGPHPRVLTFTRRLQQTALPFEGGE